MVEIDAVIKDEQRRLLRKTRFHEMRKEFGDTHVILELHSHSSQRVATILKEKRKLLFSALAELFSWFTFLWLHDHSAVAARVAGGHVVTVVTLIGLPLSARYCLLESTYENGFLRFLPPSIISFMIRKVI
jgi:hypothetical protein